jgi:hypothetical protein
MSSPIALLKRNQVPGTTTAIPRAAKLARPMPTANVLAQLMYVGTDVRQHDFLQCSVAHLQPCLDGSAERDNFVGIDARGREATEHARDRLADERHSGRAAGENH